MRPSPELLQLHRLKLTLYAATSELFTHVAAAIVWKSMHIVRSFFEGTWSQHGTPSLK